jgi:hypothetical protein
MSVEEMRDNPALWAMAPHAKAQERAEAVIAAFDAWSAERNAYSVAIGLAAATERADEIGSAFYAAVDRLMAIQAVTLRGLAMQVKVAREILDNLSEERLRHDVLRLASQAPGGLGAASRSPEDNDTELLALEIEITRLNAFASQIDAERIEPFTNEFLHLAKTDWAACTEFSIRTGRNDAVNEMCALLRQADRLAKRLQAIPAATQAGRAAKVRAFLIHGGRDEWRGDAKSLDYPEEQARALLGEFAGMSAEEIAAI